MFDLQKEIGEWAIKQFKTQNVYSIFQHLLEEMAELEDALQNDHPDYIETIKEELSDCGILLFDISDILHIDLQDGMNKKMHANKYDRE